MLMSEASGSRETTAAPVTPGSARRSARTRLRKGHRAVEVVAVHLEVEVDEGDWARVVAEVRAAGHQQAARQQGARHQQDQRQRELRDHEGVAQRHPPPHRAFARGIGLERGDQVELRTRPSAGASPNSIVVAIETAGGEGEHGPVEPEVEVHGHGQPVRARAGSGSGPPIAARRHARRCRRAAASTRLSLEELPHQARAAGARGPRAPPAHAAATLRGPAACWRRWRRRWPARARPRPAGPRSPP